MSRRVSRALLLGLLQGPTELAPVSSSAHTALATRLIDGRRGGEDAEAGKRMEVALHGGSAPALALAMRRRLRRSWARLGGGRHGRRAAAMALAAAPPALVGYMLESRLQRRLGGVGGVGGPQSIAAGLVAGAAAMALADRSPGERILEQAGAADGLALGLAQAAALAPGVSRRGATLAAARMRGFTRADADELSWLAALPVIAGACLLKGARAAERGLPAAEQGTLAVGAGAAAASTLASVAALGPRRWTDGPLAPFCAYRAALALLVVRAMRDN